MADDLTYPAEAMRQANAEARRWKARHDDLAAAVAALADDASRRYCGQTALADDLRDLLADPAAVLAERDARVKAEALREFRRLVVRCYPKGMVPTALVIADIQERIDREGQA